MAEHGHQVTTYAYVLINTEPLRTEAVLERLKTIPRARVREVLGPYDIVVELEEDGPEYLTRTVREKIRAVQGVISTVTCTWVDA